MPRPAKNNGIRQESFENLKDANTVEEPNGQENKKRGDRGLVKRLGRDTQEFNVPQPPLPDTQAGEGGYMYYVPSSPSKPKDREGPIKEKGIGNGGKDIKAESPKEARQRSLAASRTPSSIVHPGEGASESHAKGTSRVP